MSEIYKKDNIENARELRKNMTDQERKLWFCFLRSFDIRFQRQKCIDNFIADFYCHSARLIIELDGSQHYTDQGKKQDNVRTEVLEKYGIHVLRFSNKDVDENFKGVCRMIDRIIKERIERFS